MNDVVEQRGALVGFAENPMATPMMRRARPGLSLQDLFSELPENNGLIVCSVNGAFLLREHWDMVPDERDIVVFRAYPQKSGVITFILGLVVEAIGILTSQPELVALGADLELSGALSVVLSLLMPVRGQKQANDSAALGVFGTSLAGNTARLDQPIWKNCGRTKITPPFASGPYVEYLPSSPANPYLDCDQYYYVVFALGEGFMDIEKSFIGKTALAHFQDVQRAAYLAPGVQPSVVKCNVVTSAEVNTSLDLKKGRYVGGYAACRPGDVCVAIGIDVVADSGMGKVNKDGSSAATTVVWVVQVRTIDDYGTATGNWLTVATETRSLQTNNPQRWGNQYTLTTPARVEVRVARSDNYQAGDASARDAIAWTGLRGYLQAPAPLDPNTSHFEVVLRSGSQLSGQSQRDFGMIVRGYCRTWNPTTGWSDPVFTRNAAWWLADLWTNPIWGEGLPDSRIDLPGLYAWSQTLDARQDHFDYTFTSATSSWEAAQLIAQTGRARASRRNGVYTVTRDEAVLLPVAALTARNTQPQSMILHSILPKLEQPDGIVVQYMSLLTWDTEQEECPCMGYSATSTESPFYNSALPMMSNPVYLALEGITGRMQALREGIFHAYDMALRRTTASGSVELEGLVLAFLDPVRFQPLMLGYGTAGDVVDFNTTTLVMTLTEPPDFSAGAPYLTLQRDDMTLTAPVAVMPGPLPYTVVLPALPDFVLYLDYGGRERPKYILSLPETGDEMTKVSAISDGGRTNDGAPLAKIELVVDDPRVHAADHALLPGPGDIQDPIDDGISAETSVAFTVTVNIDATRNKGQDHSSGGIDYSGSAKGVTISGLNPDWDLALSLADGPNIAWSEWASDHDPYITHAGLPWGNSFVATSDLGTGGEAFGAMSVGATAEAARALFSGGTLTGSTSWTFWFNSDAINDNRGGLSIVVTKV